MKPLKPLTQRVASPTGANHPIYEDGGRAGDEAHDRLARVRVALLDTERAVHLAREAAALFHAGRERATAAGTTIEVPRTSPDEAGKEHRMG